MDPSRSAAGDHVKRPQRQDWRVLPILVATGIIALLADWHLSRWLLEGARPEMAIAWVVTGGWFLFGLLWLLLIVLAAAVVGETVLIGADDERQEITTR